MKTTSGKKKAHKHKLFGPVALGTPPECPRDKPGLSPGQSGFVPGTNPGFLLILHSGSPVCPWDIPSLSLGHSQFVPGTFRGRRAADRVYVLKVYVPFSFPNLAESAPWRSSQSCVTGGQQPIGNPYRFLSFFLHTWQALCDPNSHSWGRLFQLPGG